MFSLRTARLNLFESVLKTLDRRRPNREADHREAKRAAKIAAFFYLRRIGLTVVARDWQDGMATASIDLIAWDRGTLCFVEVQSYTSRPRTSPVVDSSFAQPGLSRTARRYLKLVSDRTVHRFDILRVLPVREDPPDPKAVVSRAQKRSVEFEYIHDAFKMTENTEGG